MDNEMYSLENLDTKCKHFLIDFIQASRAQNIHTGVTISIRTIFEWLPECTRY